MGLWRKRVGLGAHDLTDYRLTLNYEPQII
jgi:hypothetical protein